MSSFYKPIKEIVVAPKIGELTPPPWRLNNHQKSDCEAWSCTFAPDDSLFAWSCGNRIVVLIKWDAKNSRPIIAAEGEEIKPAPLTIDCGHTVWAVAMTFSESSNLMSPFNCIGSLLLATGLSNSRIRIWDASTGRLLLELMDHKDVIRDLTFAPDGSLRLVSASRDMTLKVWDLKDGGNMIKTLHGHHKWVFGCCWAPNSRLLASVGGKIVLVWNTLNKEYSLRHRLDGGHTNDVVGCDFSQDSALLATCSWDTRVILWDPYDGQQLKTLCHVFPPPRRIYASGANNNCVRGVRFSHDGSNLSSIADDGYVRFWNLFDETSDPVQVAEVGQQLCCAYSSSGRSLAVGTRSGSVSFFRSPSSVLSLRQICRMTVRSSMPSNVIEQLEIPRLLHAYLQYKEWQ